MVLELRDHYSAVHRVLLQNDDVKEQSAPQQTVEASAGGKAPKRKSITKSIITASMSPTSFLPQYPVPLAPLQLHLQQNQPQVSLQQQQLILRQVSSVFSGGKEEVNLKPIVNAPGDCIVTTTDDDTSDSEPAIASGPCTSWILARTRGELTTFGTSLLRPEAAAHKVHNSSRKPKDVVIDELWRHYVTFHAKELLASSATEPGWVGNVIDDDEDK